MNRRRQRRIERGFTALTAALALATIFGWMSDVHPWFEPFTNVPNLLLVIGIVVLTAALAAGLRRHALVAAIVVAWFLVSLWPYWSAQPDPVTSDGIAVRAMQYTVAHDTTDLNGVATAIEDANADIVALHEITVEQWEQLAPRMTEFPFALVEPFDPAMANDASAPVPGGGMALLSRTQLLELRASALTINDRRPILAAVTDVGGLDVVLVGLRPQASRLRPDDVDERNDQLDAVAQLLDGERRPAIVFADIDMAPTSTGYQRLLAELGWRDPHTVTGWEAGWPEWAGDFGIPLDHVLVSNQFALHRIRKADGPGPDDGALVADMSLPR